MSTGIRNILERLERGEIGSQDAIHAIASEKERPMDIKDHFLRIDVKRLHDEMRQVHVKIPLRMLELGLALGSKYAPELDALDLSQIVEDLHAAGEGTLLEVEDINDDQHVLISIERA